MARQPSETGSAEESDAPLEELDTDLEEEDDDSAPTARSAAAEALWTDVRVQPVEIALPSGVGYTLRAYRLSTEVREPEIGDREDDFPTRATATPLLDEDLDEKEVLAEIDEDELTAQALAAGEESDNGRHRAGDEAESDEAESDGDEAGDADRSADALDGRDGANEDDEDAADEDAADDGESDEDEDDEAAGAEAAEPEDVPVFLAESGKLLLFRSAEGLVDYVRGSDSHELAQLDMWAELRERIEPDDVVPLDEDRYELDLVVENLRGGHDAWDPELIIQAGEVARDVAYALRLQSVVSSLAPGSPLDDLDEGLRRVEAGGFGSFFAKRRVRRIDPQTTAALGWRTIIGKISAAVDWRD